MVQQRGTKLLFFLGGVKHHSMGCSVIFIRITQSRRRKKKERRKKEDRRSKRSFFENPLLIKLKVFFLLKEFQKY